MIIGMIKAHSIRRRMRSRPNCRPYPYHSCCRAPVIGRAQVRGPWVSVADRRDPVASCWEWHGDGTAGDDGRGLGPGGDGVTRAMGETRPSATPASVTGLTRWP
jgi:hypothetical protein